MDVEVIIEDIKKVGHQFERCDFAFVRRTANAVADKLAKSGLRGIEVRTWEARPPAWLLSSLEKDNHLF